MKNGVVSQIFHDGTACGYAFSRIIVDCTIGEAVVFGPSSYGGAMTDVEVAVRDLQPYEQLSQRIDQLADAEQPIKVQEIFETANRNNMPNAKIVSIVGTQIGISNSDARPQHNYDFSCGCKLYYPNSQGAKS